MTSKTIITSIIALSLTTGMPAFAQGWRDQDHSRANEQQQRFDQNQQMRRFDRNDRRASRALQSQRDQDQGRSNNSQGRDYRGAGPNHSFHPGQRLPPENRRYQYVVEDWRGHHLSPPPRGYHWVQTGADYVLVAVATGLIMQLLLNN